MPESKKTIHIDTVLRTLQLPAGSESYDVIFKLATHWKSIVGKEMLKLSAPIAFQRGVLTLGIRDPTLIFECQHASQDWLFRLNQFLGKDVIKKVEFKLI